MKTQYEYDPEFIRLYEEAEFEKQYAPMITAALRRIDRVRAALTTAQNELVYILQGSNDHTRAAFSTFYADGGVTAKDWKRRIVAAPPPRSSQARGQLRVVRRKVD